MKFTLRKVIWAAFLVLLLAVMATPSLTIFRRYEILWLVDHAKSIELVHYNPYAARQGGEIIYGTKALTSEESSKLATAFPLSLDTGIPLGAVRNCLFAPHHEIVLTDSAGRKTVIRVCLLCAQVKIDDASSSFDAPLAWIEPLKKFFADEGLPFSPDRYMEDSQKYREKQGN